MATDYKKILEELIEYVIKADASDLHLSVDRPPMIRVAGSLIPLVKQAALSAGDTLGFMEQLLTPDDQKLFLDERQIDFSFAYKNSARFRGNCFFQQGSVSVALRLIPRKIKSIAELGLPSVLDTFTQTRQGFFLVVGPIGHGKTTTLASMIESINASRAEHILTIEDPIEYVYEQKLSVVNQREVRTDTRDFHTALESVFREDINVLMIGEMRDIETISTAVTAAETGHLVFSTLHTNNAAQTIDRIIDAFPAAQQDQIRIQLAGSLAAIFSQRLIPRISGGLVPAYELLINNSAVSNLIREKRIHEIDTVIETGLEQGMMDMNRSLADLVRAGEITEENALRHSLNPKSLGRLI
ncbi:PilT/PilU family type 4a pilus ATPase [Patescibacteria group bacterium]|nr:PilT/PilU family type 4a pilus ATPase [Patescibacteria group bacterium]